MCGGINKYRVSVLSLGLIDLMCLRSDTLVVLADDIRMFKNAFILRSRRECVPVS